jgi:glyceraldehyde 3-phosphate dehydrogenase
MKKVAINGFGRIGRNALRAFLQSPHAGFEIVAVNTGSQTPAQAAHLLKYDSALGKLDHAILCDDHNLYIDGRKIAFSRQPEPELCPWEELGIDIVLECSGEFTDVDSASGHLAAGAGKVLISAPTSDSDVATIVIGVNESDYNPQQHHIVSNASCTTNCLAPVAKVLDDHFGIESGLITTVHSYTLDQKLLDGSHKDLRRARAAAASIIPTSTGAARTIGRVLPKLQGKLDGLALRVPTLNVSIVDLVVNTRAAVTTDAILKALREASEGELHGILSVSREPLVSCDFRGDPHSAIVDGALTMVAGARTAKVLAWYDNEWAYALRLIDMAKLVAGVSPPRRPAVAALLRAPVPAPQASAAAVALNQEQEAALQDWSIARKDRDFG